MAASSKGTIVVNVVASDRPVWSGRARSVTIPATEGAMGILPDHEPVLVLTKKGTLTVVQEDGQRTDFPVSAGFVSFDSNKLTVAVDRCDDESQSA
ncbi:ATP synthase epsilon subunit [Bifidobacterium actinocoloniiforme DSM 22766]|uniref:ATP synthase epsilon subunit n=1 Tax=Bifidobacterium actinocoloniiforme DSM 22766 TaxID=1437605 RepID=A0A086YVT5_9BIFI|nr:F0F1 ATP synthase subunit epsilon [Bifidobacterium actinocoloniiforme]AKV54959.1 ATP synthase F0F1 subunit epsilon [Bifidobacterium actinocoloniiforme DSM 22766]KFI38385.1 ATP synthase epsilon subunit [Bifidobacterium actinocoloniiforme DSM 22766]